MLLLLSTKQAEGTRTKLSLLFPATPERLLRQETDGKPTAPRTLFGHNTTRDEHAHSLTKDQNLCFSLAHLLLLLPLFSELRAQSLLCH